MFNLTPFGGQGQSNSSVNVFDVLNNMESMMINTFQSAFAPMNNTSFTDQGSDYVFTLTLPNLTRENIQLAVENQNLILTIKQVIQTNQDQAQSYQSSSYSQSFNLYDVEVDKITAQLKDDTLTITMPKKEAVVINRRLINIL